VGEMFWTRIPWGGGGEGGREREGGEGGGRGGGRGAGGGERGARACVRACVRACTRRLTCPLLPNVNWDKPTGEPQAASHGSQSLNKKSANLTDGKPAKKSVHFGDLPTKKPRRMTPRNPSSKPATSRRVFPGTRLHQASVRVHLHGRPKVCIPVRCISRQSAGG
jgi:hypothetical protein